MPATIENSDVTAIRPFTIPNVRADRILHPAREFI